MFKYKERVRKTSYFYLFIFSSQAPAGTLNQGLQEGTHAFTRRGNRGVNYRSKGWFQNGYRYELLLSIDFSINHLKCT